MGRIAPLQPHGSHAEAAVRTKGDATVGSADSSVGNPRSPTANFTAHPVCRAAPEKRNGTALKRTTQMGVRSVQRPSTRNRIGGSAENLE